MFKKILLGLILSLVLIGAAYAVDQTSFTAPSDFEDIGDGVYVLYDNSKNAKEILSVVKYTEHDIEDYMANDTENDYTVFEGENNTFHFVDKSVNEQGSFEVIDVDGNKFIIDFAKIGIDNENDFNDTFDNLLEFNKLNNVTAMENPK